MRVPLSPQDGDFYLAGDASSCGVVWVAWEGHRVSARKLQTSFSNTHFLTAGISGSSSAHLSPRTGVPHPWAMDCPLERGKGWNADVNECVGLDPELGGQT